ncbi:MAG: flagellar hook-length control protein FliK [Caldilinea sp. CFX5]|nr:flagellar hook-length control protein FliK [Caldilinea sp. CFX5]
MSTVRVMVYFMNEEERTTARELVAEVGSAESYLLGDIDEGQLAVLTQQGLLYQVIEEQSQVETPGGDWTPLPGAARAVGRPELIVKSGEIDWSRPNFFLIQLHGPLLELWRTKLADLGVTLLEYVPHNHYTARLTVEQVAAINALDFVVAVKPYTPQDAVPTLVTKSVRAPDQDQAALGLPALHRQSAGRDVHAPDQDQAALRLDIRLHQPDDLAKTRRWLEEQGVNIAGSSRRKIRIALPADSLLLPEIAALPEVAAIEEYIPPKLLNEIARKLLGIAQRSAHGMTSALPQSGEGQIVAVADTGFDATHRDFQGRIAGIVALGRPDDASDPHGHGTHVAGSAVGNGAASNGKICGTAPKAKLFFQSLLDVFGRLSGLPIDLYDLFDPAYQAGARIHNNSWGSATASTYTASANEVDEFVHDHRDMLIVIAAGNEGQAAMRRHSRTGYVDWLSINSPASAKNALTVGASRSSRRRGGLTTMTYREYNAKLFPDPPIAKERVSGNPEKLAGFSSRGPCDDRRIKPDLVAPGTDILSTRSAQAADSGPPFWGAYAKSPAYAYMGGTSMATPLVSGCAALVREYYLKERQHEPAAALVKATLINGTRHLTGADAVADHKSLPNYHQGFGGVYMPTTLPNPARPGLKLEFVDTWKNAERQFMRTGQDFQYLVTVGGDELLRICMVWTDLPGRALQNNLNLIVRLPTGEKCIGNADAPLGLGIPDPDNNVEIVRIEKPPAGNYTIQILAQNLLRGPQDFALVVTGDLKSPLARLI